MGTLYMTIPRDTSAPFDLVEVATTTSLKTLLQVGINAASDIRIHGWGVSYKGVAAADPPIKTSLCDCAVASTGGTSLTPEEWEGSDGPASVHVGGTALTAYNLTSPTETGVRFLDGQEIHPQSGYSLFFVPDRRPEVKAGRFLKIRCLATVSVSSIPWILWEEPS